MPGNDGIGLLGTPALRVFLWEGMVMPNPLYRQHIISISDLTTEQLELLLQTALKLKKQPREDLLEGKLIGSCFFEPSTRTRLSFETAVQRLGGKVIGFSDGANTSAKRVKRLRILRGLFPAIRMRLFSDTRKTVRPVWRPSFRACP